jgi:hypothetical protein
MRWFSIRIYTPHPLPFRIDAKPQKRVAGCFPAYPVGVDTRSDQSASARLHAPA